MKERRIIEVGPVVVKKGGWCDGVVGEMRGGLMPS